MEVESFDETKYIYDTYGHLNANVFYVVNRIPGKGVAESQFDYFESGCSCPESKCTEWSNCSCLKYGSNYKLTTDGLLLMKEKLENLPVFECNVQCSCFENVKISFKNEKLDIRTTPNLCLNRKVQFGPIEGLEIFNAGDKGLGLRTKKKIPAGEFICEYAGEVIGLQEAKKRQRASSGMNYIFILREFTGDNLSGVTCVDPTHVGNIGRYINHSCQPNAAIVPVRVNDSIPWLCIFAVRDIEGDEEICYDYSGCTSREQLVEGNRSRKPCLCNSTNCKKFLPFEVNL